MNAILLPIFALGTFWDGFTTFLGAYSILGPSFSAQVGAGIAALVVSGVLLNTSSMGDHEEFIGFFTSVIWFACLLFSLFTSFKGNVAYIFGGNMNRLIGSISSLEADQIIVLILMSVVTSASPIVLSPILKNILGNR